MKKLLFIILLTGLLTACQVDALPYGNLTDDTCSAPCWHGITPGKTTREEAVAILQKMDSVEADSFGFSNQKWQGLNRFSWAFQRSGVGLILLKNNIVYAIIFSPESRDSMFDREEGLNIKFSDAIGKFGEPASIFSVYMDEPPPWEEIWALYPEKGISFVYTNMGEQWNFLKELTPETPISKVLYYSPSTHQEVMDILIIGHPYIEEELKNCTHPWSGYGTIREKYPSDWVLKELKK